MQACDELVRWVNINQQAHLANIGTCLALISLVDPTIIWGYNNYNTTYQYGGAPYLCKLVCKYNNCRIYS